MEETMNASKQALIDGFGEQHGAALFAIAVKLSNRHNIPVEDAAGDLAIAALETEAEFGFLHLNTAANKARAMIARTYRYGVNEYYGDQGVVTDSLEAIEDHQDGGDAFDVLGEAGVQAAFATVEDAEIRLSVASTLETLSDRDQQIARGLMQGLSGAEIGERLGCSRQYVYKRKRAMRETFAGLIY
jgi:DNA-binding NarL/FixJ family response regulator